VSTQLIVDFKKDTALQNIIMKPDGPFSAQGSQSIDRTPAGPRTAAIGELASSRKAAAINVATEKARCLMSAMGREPEVRHSSSVR